MITPEIAYFLKANIGLAIFFVFYRLFFSKDTFFHWRRTALLCFCAISFLYPLMNLGHWMQNQESVRTLATLYSAYATPMVKMTPVAPEAIHGQDVAPSFLLLLYGTGVIIGTIRFLWHLIGIFSLRFHCKRSEVMGHSIFLLNKESGPFSFFHWIFLNPSIHTADELKEILTHEQTHTREWHSIDVLIGEGVCVWCWFNPFAWLLKQEIRNNLEYLADYRVLEQGYNSKAYQYHLLGLTSQGGNLHLSNNFNLLPIKKRITMMNKQRTKSIGKAKYMVFVPLAIALLLISNIELVARNANRITQQISLHIAEEDVLKGIVVDENGKPIQGVSIVIKGTQEGTISMKDGSFELKTTSKDPILSFSFVGKRTIELECKGEQKLDRKVVIMAPQVQEILDEVVVVAHTERQTPVKMKQTVPNSGNKQKKVVAANKDAVIFQVVEEMPEFPGGPSAMMEYLAKNIRYPAEARQEKRQGRVIVQFTVLPNGTLADISPIRQVSPDLDEEAVRVIKEMPQWKPGKQRGQSVAVQYTIPVTFRIP